MNQPELSESQLALQDHKKKTMEKKQQANQNIWQHPFVDVFKHFKVQPGSDWKSNKKQGDINEYFVSETHFVILLYL